uniref:Bestrophin homolog n=1 Tax=Pseudo-nitzschia delicatissima TaxID=44447 RepID=A0A7S0UL36_9STRA|mmetsp:Transcript_591/g.1214  ORF Transcript_591/g.1214 Transcript_591/m.1214 type:complete len:570 (+) Transcript_591:75-1784(+)
MAITTTNDTKRSRNRKRADRTSAALRLGLISTYYCLALTSVYQSSQIQTCAAFSPLFTASTKPSTNIASVSKTLSSASARAISSMAPKGKKEKKGKKKKEEDHRRWMSWLSSGTTSRHADEVRMREAEELGGVARSDRYSAGDWWHNTLSLPNSAILRSIRGPVLFMSCWSWILSMIYRNLLSTNAAAANAMCISSLPHSLMSSALSLLLVFKTNSAYQRFAEGRKIWENIINLSRDTYRLINLYENEMGRSKRRRLQRLLAAFPYLLRHRIRPNLIMFRVDDAEKFRDPENSIVLYQDRADNDLDPELAAVATQEEKEGQSRRRKKRPLYWVDKRTLPWRLLPSDALEPCARSQNRPLWVCDRMAHELRSIPDGPNFTSRERLTLIGKIEKLSNSIGSCERIHQTAVPLNYARHSLRALTIWLFTLPFCMLQSLELLTAPAVFLVSWLMFGVYEIGYSIEDPFQGTLRLSVLCDTIRRDVLADEVIRNTAFDTGMTKSSSSSKQQASAPQEHDEQQEYETSPVLKVDTTQIKSKDKLGKKVNSTIVEQELPVLPSKKAIWEQEQSKRP